MQQMNLKQKLVWSIVSKINVLTNAQKNKIKVMISKCTDDELSELVQELSKARQLTLAQLQEYKQKLHELNTMENKLTDDELSEIRSE